MPNSLGLPEFGVTETPEDFARKLRQYVFKNQMDAACYHGVNRSTISKYERYDFEHYQHRIVPPAGYIASLACLIVEKEKQAGADEARLIECQRFLLAQIARLLKACPVEYRYMEPFHNWQQLCAAADAYRVEHTRRQTGRQVELAQSGATEAVRVEVGYPYVAGARTRVNIVPAHRHGVCAVGADSAGVPHPLTLSVQEGWMHLYRRMRGRLLALCTRPDALVPMAVGAALALAALISRLLPPNGRRAW